MGYIEEKLKNEAALLDAVLSDHEAISSIMRNHSGSIATKRALLPDSAREML